MYEFHLFAGGGGGIYGGLLLGHTPIGAVEIEKYQQKVLLARQADGTFPKFPIWNDVRTFTKHNNNCRQFIKQLRHVRNNLIIAGGFPCQDISVAGKGAGLSGERSGLWAEYLRIISEIRPRYAFIENSPMLTVRGLDRVLCDLTKAGYNATWCVMGADDVKAPHRRKRIWILANARCRSRRGHRLRSTRGNGEQRQTQTQEWAYSDNATGRPSPRLKVVSDTDKMWQLQSQGSFCELWRRTGNGSIEDVSNADNAGIGRREQLEESEQEARNTSDILSYATCERQSRQRQYQQSLCSTQDCKGKTSEFINGSSAWWEHDPADLPNAIESQMGRVAHGVANRGKRLETLGNGQVPAVAALAFTILQERLEK